MRRVKCLLHAVIVGHFCAVLRFLSRLVQVLYKRPGHGKRCSICPTPTEVVDEMLGIAEVGSEDALYDLGCGDGWIFIAAAKRRGAYRSV